MYTCNLETKEMVQVSPSLHTLLADLGRRLRRIEVALGEGKRPAEPDDAKFKFGEGVVDRKKFAYINKRCEFVRLSPRELMLLCMFAEHPNEVLARDMLLSRIWGIDFYGNTRTLDQHVSRLRQKLGADGEKIVTVSRIGYAYEPAQTS